jgi:hypothetical protein
VLLISTRTPTGGNTGLVLGSVPTTDEVVLSLAVRRWVGTPHVLFAWLTHLYIPLVHEYVRTYARTVLYACAVLCCGECAMPRIRELRERALKLTVPVISTRAAPRTQALRHSRSHSLTQSLTRSLTRPLTHSGDEQHIRFRPPQLDRHLRSWGHSRQPGGLGRWA